ncbi:YcaO-related McrA-glycine thioamidation protein [Methanobrevibacter sp. OttesenSCG-928-K11]|nr:YcaO-related McrA-glycine thioamidation protein [Methanobrevibacter sp. OttesenSCG-928-K11]MDL2271023.1 YcaO-related McrA-glycine thioamidation protein [Methanobrevibacter sp. OttesenSCG-928-I08]
MFENTPIKYFQGTHRIISPSQTIKNHENKLKIAGITRITEITDLDRIGIPVFSAIRPTSEEGSISIYSGKGVDTTQAKASAMMEGFERYSAEKQENDDIILGTIDEISNYGNPINIEDLNLPKSTELKDIELEWNKAIDIIDEKEYYVPSNSIYHPYTPSKNTNSLFKSNTNGIASGNSLEEAILHGIYELIERDAWSIFELTKKNKKEINKESITSPLVNNLLDKFEKESINIKLLDLTADIGISTIAASSDDTLLKDPALLTLGVGTHLNPEIAISRALTEVAQSRATQIHGAREDTVRADFMRKAGYERMKKINKHYFGKEENTINFEEIENKGSSTIKNDIQTAKEELQKCNIDKILYTDLTREELDVSVARVIIPTLELYSIDSSRLGKRFLKI